MLIIAHRGYHAEARPNTLASFEEAVALGVDGIETDVRLSRDGVAILYHDRCVGEGIEVSKLTHAELEKLLGYSVPTLESALAAHENILWNLEIKTSSVVEQTARLVKRYKSKTRLLITSFLHPTVYEIAGLVDVDVGLLFAHLPAHPEKFCRQAKLDPCISTLVWDYESCDSRLIAIASEHGFKNLVYGPINKAEHQKALGWKVHGIITDHPRFLMYNGIK